MWYKRAFTLAEALLTLAVIGVVAALTLPALYVSITNARQTVSFKRIFAESYSAITELALDDDCSNSLTCTHLFKGTQAESTKNFGDALTATLAISKNCGVDTNDSCFSHTVRTGLESTDSKTVYEILTSDGIFNAKPYTFVSTRGVAYAVYSLGLDCLSDSSDSNVQAYKTAFAKKYDGEDDKSNPMLNVCGLVVVDINGTGSPNVWGRDVFGMWITDNQILGLQPFGEKHDKIYPMDTSCTDTNSRGCAGKIVQDGWSMEY